MTVEELGREATPAWLLHLLGLLGRLWLTPHVVHAVVGLLLLWSLLPAWARTECHCVKGVVLVSAWCSVRILVVHAEDVGEALRRGGLWLLLLRLAAHLLTPAQ